MRVDSDASQLIGTSSRVAMSGSQCDSGRVMVLVVMALRHTSTPNTTPCRLRRW